MEAFVARSPYVPLFTIPLGFPVSSFYVKGTVMGIAEDFCAISLQARDSLCLGLALVTSGQCHVTSSRIFRQRRNTASGC